MADATVRCPACGSEDVAVRNGRCICWECGHRFNVPEPSADSGKAETPLRIFLSYGHTEEEIVHRIKRRLEARGHEVWFDQSEIKAGDDWRASIAEGVASSNGVIACLSKHAFREGGVCHDEIDIAVAVRGGSIKTVLLDPEGEVRPPSVLTHIQWLDMAIWREKLAAGPEVFEPWFDRCMAELVRVVESRESLRFSGDITEISRRLTVLVDSSRQAALLAKPFQGRSWLADKVATWLQDRSSPRVCLVTGDAGVGKSAFAAHLSHWDSKLTGYIAASLFCVRGRSAYNDPRIVIQTLAYLLACRIPQYRVLLKSALARTVDLGALDEGSLFSLLIGEPLSHAIDGGHECMAIVIDGIDEAGGAEENALAEVIGRYADSLPTWMKVLVTSRRVSAATDPFGLGAELIDLSSESAENMEDVQAFLTARLAERFGANPGFPQTIRTLSDASGGIFLYADLMADAILKGRASLDEATTERPQGLSGMFYQWFRWTFPDLREYREMFRSALGCVIVAPGGALPLSELPVLFGWDGNTQNDFLRRIEVFVRHTEAQVGGPAIAFSHAFIAEWLASPEAGAYRSVPQDALVHMGKRWYEQVRTWEGYETRLPEYEAMNIMGLLASPGLEREHEELWAGSVPWSLNHQLNTIFLHEEKRYATKSAEQIARHVLGQFASCTQRYEPERCGWIYHLADCCFTLNAYTEAEELLITLMDRYEHIPDHASGDSFYRKAAIARKKLADVQLQMGKYAEAEQTLLEIIDAHAAEERARGKETPSPASPELYFKLGKVQEALGKTLETMISYARAASEYRRLMKENAATRSGTQYRKKLANVLIAAGNLQGRLGDEELAQELYAEAYALNTEDQEYFYARGQKLVIFLELKQDDGSATWSGRVARDRLREFMTVEEYYAHAETKLTDSAIWERKLEESLRDEHNRNTSWNCRRLAQTLYREGRLEEAERRFKQALGMEQENCRENEGCSLYFRLRDLTPLLDCVNVYALFLHNLGRDDDVLALYRENLPNPSDFDPHSEMLEARFAKNSSNKSSFTWFCEKYVPSLLLYAGFLADTGRQVESAEMYRRAFYLDREYESGFQRDCFKKAANAMSEEARAATSAGDLEAAERLYRDSLAIFTHLSESRVEGYRGDLAKAHMNLARFLHNKLHEYGEATQHYEEALAIRRKLAEKEPEKFGPAVAASCLSLGISLENLGEPERAIALLREAADRYLELSESEPEAYKAEAAYALRNLQRVLYKFGREEEAQAVAIEETQVLNNLGGKASSIDFRDLFLGTTAQIFVDRLLFQLGKYRSVDSRIRDDAIVQLDDRLWRAAIDTLSDEQFQRLNELRTAADKPEVQQQLIAFVADSGYAETMNGVIAAFYQELVQVL